MHQEIDEVVNSRIENQNTKMEARLLKQQREFDLQIKISELRSDLVKIWRSKVGPKLQTAIPLVWGLLGWTVSVVFVFAVSYDSYLVLIVYSSSVANGGGARGQGAAPDHLDSCLVSMPT
jgi:hypothetical protein